jgi:hypothetical protein
VLSLHPDTVVEIKNCKLRVGVKENGFSTISSNEKW